MEDLPGVMGKTDSSADTGTRGLREHGWSVMFVSEHGRLVQVKHFTRYVAIAVGVVMASMLVAVCCFLFFLSEKRETGKLEAFLEASRSEIRSLVDRNDTLLARIAVFSAADGAAESSGAPEDDSDVAGNSDNLPTVDETSDDEFSDGPSVIIEGLRIVQTSETHASRIEFTVKKPGNSTDTVSGRFFVVLDGENSRGPRTLVVPAVPMHDGIPAQPARGQYFSIARYKPVTMTVQIENPHEFETATVYIFATNGALLYKAFFPVRIV